MANYYASLPHNYLKLLGLPPRYSLVLAPDVVANPDFYMRAYDRSAIPNPIYSVIVDSGVVEKLHFTDEMLIEACKILGADILVLPDEFLDGPATIRRISNFLTRHGSNPVVRRTTLMGVVQGSSRQEILECLDALVGMSVEIIGIPYRLSQFMPRIEIAALIKMFSHRKVHYLGMHNITGDIQDCRMMEKYVDSIDSAVPVTLGFWGQKIKPSMKSIPASIRERALCQDPNAKFAERCIQEASYYCRTRKITNA